jgi:serine acetyltransferase
VSEAATVKEGLLRGLFNRILQQLARVVPGATSLRVSLHRARGVRIGRGVWIGYDVILETSRPSLIVLEEDCTLSVRVMIVAHFRESKGVKIERDVFIGPGAIILPGVVVGRGSVVTAGSVVTRSVPPMTVVQGNPAAPVARCEVSLLPGVSLKEFTRHLRPLSSRSKPAKSTSDSQIQTSNR